MAEQELVRLTYASTAQFEQDAGRQSVDLEIGRILRACKINNPKREIGGVLHYGYGYFFQALEGERAAVEALYEKIAQDGRHGAVQILDIQPIDRRYFPDWSMKYVPLERDVDQLLKRHGMSTFNPYRFDQAVIEDMVQMMVAGADAGQLTATEPPRRKGGIGGFLQRLLKG